MEKDWVLADSYSMAAIAELKKAVLLENDIEAIVLNAQDSSYMFGSVELYVHRDNLISAKRLLEEGTPNE
ncbi:MAG: hypothetical protein ACI9YU_000791 [Flavobacteriales bacterium]|jgi:hypothetical protein